MERPDDFRVFSGGQVLGDPAYLEAAAQGALFVRSHLTQGDALVRSYRQGASNVAGLPTTTRF